MSKDILRKDKLIRNVNDELWNRAKAMAQLKGLKIRELIEKLLEEWTNKQEQEFVEEVKERKQTIAAF